MSKYIFLLFLFVSVNMISSLLFTGVLVDFISIPVTVGFTSATSVIIACSQLKGLLGLSFKSNGFLDTVNKVWTHIPKTRPWDATLGFTCIIVLLLLRVRKVYPCTGWSIVHVLCAQPKPVEKVFSVSLYIMFPKLVNEFQLNFVFVVYIKRCWTDLILVYISLCKHLNFTWRSKLPYWFLEERVGYEIWQ